MEKQPEIIYLEEEPDFRVNKTHSTTEFSTQADSLEEFDLPNLKLAFQFAYERYEIYLKKEKECLPPPWTEDKILQTYRFCNLHRENDNISRTIINYLQLCTTTKQLIFNAINFRRLNHNWTIGSLGILDTNNYRPVDFVNCLVMALKKQSKCEGVAKFNDGAYVIPPPAGETFGVLLKMLEDSFENGEFDDLMEGVKVRVSKKTFEHRKNCAILNRMEKKGFVEVTKNFHNFKIFLFSLQNLLILPKLDVISKANGTIGLYSEIRKLNGIGPFLAGQICVDIGYINKQLFDENELAPAGPGCMKGLNLLYNMDVPKNPNEKIEQLLLKNIRKKQFQIWKILGYEVPSFGKMSLMTIENLMCEASKYIGLVHSLSIGGKPSRGRKKYKKRKTIEEVKKYLDQTDKVE